MVASDDYPLLPAGSVDRHLRGDDAAEDGWGPDRGLVSVEAPPG